MKDRLIILFLVTALFSCQQKSKHREEIIFNRIEYIFNLKPLIAERFWKNFDDPSYDVPLIYYTDSSSYVANPPEEFISYYKPELVFQNQQINIYKTLKRYDDRPFHMETSFDIGDTTKGIDLSTPIMNCSSFEVTSKNIPNTSCTEYWVTMVIHEYFHGFQYKHKSYFDSTLKYSSIVSEDSLAQICSQNIWFNEKIKLENAYLLKALKTTDSKETQNYIDSFIDVRSQRRAQTKDEMSFDISEYEKIYETMEGTARYIEYKLQTTFSTKRPDEKLAATDTAYHSYKYFEDYKIENDPWLYTTSDKYFYATGFNIVRLLDKLNIDYKPRLFKEGNLSLEDLLITQQLH